MTVRVRYRIAWGICFIILGAVNLVLGLLLLANSGTSPTLFLGPLFLLMGVLQLTRNYFEFEPTTRTIAVKALVGSFARRFGGADGGTLHVTGDRIVCTRGDGRTKKVPVSRLMADPDGWNAVVARLR